jgi:hypothetical protein
VSQRKSKTWQEFRDEPSPRFSEAIQEAFEKIDRLAEKFEGEERKAFIVSIEEWCVNNE